MKRIVILAAALALGTTAYAGNGQPGAHFLDSWDMNEDDQVTLEEATERRGDIFYTFDENDDGMLSAQDYSAFDAARAADQEGQEFGVGKGGQGNGGQGNQQRASVGMEMEFNDVDNDGFVSRDEFLSRSVDWFTLLDKNSDGVVTVEDFGRRG